MFGGPARDPEAFNSAGAQRPAAGGPGCPLGLAADALPRARRTPGAGSLRGRIGRTPNRLGVCHCRRCCRRPGLALGDSVELWLGDIYRAIALQAQEQVRGAGGSQQAASGALPAALAALLCCGAQRGRAAMEGCTFPVLSCAPLPPPAIPPVLAPGVPGRRAAAAPAPGPRRPGPRPSLLPVHRRPVQRDLPHSRRAVLGLGGWGPAHSRAVCCSAVPACSLPWPSQHIS